MPVGPAANPLLIKVLLSNVRGLAAAYHHVVDSPPWNQILPQDSFHHVISFQDQASYTFSCFFKVVWLTALPPADSDRRLNSFELDRIIAEADNQMLRRWFNQLARAGKTQQFAWLGIQVESTIRAFTAMLEGLALYLLNREIIGDSFSKAFESCMTEAAGWSLE